MLSGIRYHQRSSSTLLSMRPQTSTSFSFLGFCSCRQVHRRARSPQRRHAQALRPKSRPVVGSPQKQPTFCNHHFGLRPSKKATWDMSSRPRHSRLGKAQSS